MSHLKSQTCLMKKTKGSQGSRFVFLKKIHQLNKQKPPCFSSQLIWDLCPPVPPAPSLLTAYQTLFSRHTIHLVYKETILPVQLHLSNSQRLWSAANMQKYKTQEDWVLFHLRRVYLTHSTVLRGIWPFPLSPKKQAFLTKCFWTQT